MKLFRDLFVGEQFCLTVNSIERLEKISLREYKNIAGEIFSIVPMTKVYEVQLQTMWVIFQDQNGTQIPKEIPIVKIRRNVGVITQIDENITIGRIYDRYSLSDSPFEIDIIQGKNSSSVDGYGSGFGDLWAWSYHCFLNEDDAIAKYSELKRIVL